MSAEYFRPTVVKMLGNRTPEEFLRLPSAQREQILAKQQVRVGQAVIIDESGLDDLLNPEIAQSSILRQAELVGGGEVGEQVRREACEIYYGRNRFVVDSHWLGEFLGECDQDGGGVRSITVQVWLQHPWEDDDEGDLSDGEGLDLGGAAEDPLGADGGEEKGEDFDRNFWAKSRPVPLAVQDLRRLFGRETLREVMIRLIGGGAGEGSDLGTQLKAREISRVVKRLMGWMRGRQGTVRVEKVVEIDGVCRLAGREITGWWGSPRAEGRERFRRGRASFEEVMQMQMEEWTRRVGDRVGDASSCWTSWL